MSCNCNRSPKHHRQSLESNQMRSPAKVQARKHKRLITLKCEQKQFSITVSSWRAIECVHRQKCRPENIVQATKHKRLITLKCEQKQFSIKLQRPIFMEMLVTSEINQNIVANHFTGPHFNCVRICKIY